MTILNIREAGDPVLRTSANPVEEITATTKELVANMVETMQEADGVGLAAPQVGVSKRIIVGDTGQHSFKLINPELVEKSDRTYIDEEGCLSIPGETGQVERAFAVTAAGLNPEGEEVTIEAEGLLARVLQHEIDHLDGTLFTDKTL